MRGLGRLAAALAATMIVGGSTALAQGSGAAQSLRPLSTDRPDKTESAFTVPRGLVQVEFDIARMSRDRDGSVVTEGLNLAPVNLKFGLDERTDIQFIYDAYVRETVFDRTTGLRTRRQGTGDLTVRVKRNLWGNDGGPTALAIMPYVTIPVGTNGFGRGVVEGGVIVPLAIDLGGGLGLGLMTEVDLVKSERGSGRDVSFVNSATLGIDVTSRLGVYGELFTEKTARSGSGWVVTADAGITYALSEAVQLDAGVNIGVTDEADDLDVFAGISFRF